MRTSQVRDFLVNLYMSESKLIEETNGAWKRSSVMLIGPPGVGKTVSGYEAALIIAKRLGRTLVEYDDSVAEEVLSNLDKYFVYHFLALPMCERTDISGFPAVLKNGCVKFFSPLWMTVMQKCPGMLVLDDFLDVQRPDLFSEMYRLILKYRFERHSGVMMVMTNAPCSNVTEKWKLEWFKEMCDNIVIMEGRIPVKVFDKHTRCKSTS